MKVEDVMFQVDQIKEVAVTDDEKAHGLEDSLWESVLVSIAHGAKNAQGLARAALKTRLIKFGRWTS